jgi:UDP-2,4-diacetamido-2,4,6-trideoxy-beta-L-altropyranose hydrolase
MNTVFRVDASPEIGTGHLLRCLALSQALGEEAADVSFVTRTTNAILLDRIAKCSVDVIPLEAAEAPADAAFTASVAEREGAQWIVTDGYAFDTDYQRRLRTTKSRILCIDDIAACHYVSDAVLNHGLHAEGRLSYSTEPETRLLLGPRYALLRQEFASAGNPPPREPSADGIRILLTMGGSDPHACTLRCLRAIEALRLPVEMRVVLGPGFAQREEVRRLASASRYPVEVFFAVEDMVAHMRWADACITAGGTTCLELCRVGVPMAAGAIAENQVPIAASVEALSLGIDLGWLPSATPRELAARLEPWLADAEALREASRRASRLVDGRGVARVAEALADWQ